jgi:hypothetical protein
LEYSQFVLVNFRILVKLQEKSGNVEKSTKILLAAKAKCMESLEVRPNYHLGGFTMAGLSKLLLLMCFRDSWIFGRRGRNEKMAKNLQELDGIYE